MTDQTGRHQASSGPEGVRFRHAAERFHTQTDWLDSRHSFSFASHHDPAWMGHGPLRVINDDTIAPGRGFGMHPHRDMDIITVLVQGQINHQDSLGHSAVLRAGDVQRMSAGTGVIHSEINGGSEPCRLLQVWIEPQQCNMPPSYEQKAFAIQPGWTPLLDPDRTDGAMAMTGPTRLWRALPPAGAGLSLGIGSARHGWLQLISGAGSVDGLALEQGDGLGWRGGPIREFNAGPDGADLLLFALD